MKSLWVLLIGLAFGGLAACGGSPVEVPSPTPAKAPTIPETVAVPTVPVTRVVVPSPSPSPKAQGIEGRYVFKGPGVQMDCAQFAPGEDLEACEASNAPWTRPVAGATIQVRDLDNRPLESVVTDDDGAFRVALPEGDYLLCAGFCEGPITIRTGEFTLHELTLAAP